MDLVQRDAHRSRADEIYERLRDDILSSRIPPGSPLVEQRNADLSGTSRTPAREALRRLERDGLVVVIPHKGVFVATLGLSETLEIYFLREVLEPIAARLAAPRLPGELLTELESECKTWKPLESATDEDRLSYAQTVAKLHRLLYSHCGNSQLASILTMLHTKAHLGQPVNLTLYRRETADQYLDLISVLKSKDPEAIEQTMRNHIRWLREQLLQSLAVPV